MLDNPWLLICGLALCWPGPIPMLVLAALATRYKFRNPLVPKRNLEV